MAIAPLTYLEQKWANSVSTGSNQLIDAATTTSNRKSVPDLNRESFKNVSTQGRLTLASLGRKLYSDSDIVRGTVNDIADLSTNNLQGQYWGADKAWGDTAEALLEEHDKMCDVRGSPYNMRHWLRQLVISHYREGDLGTVLVENESGYPFLQTIAPHRIGGRESYAQKVVENGPWKGLRYQDGVILNKLMFPVAYRVYGENAQWSGGAYFAGETINDGDGNPVVFRVTDKQGQEIYSEVSSRSMMLSYLPAWTDQVRGTSELGTIAFTMQDVRESRALDLLGGKLFAARQFVEYNEGGEGDQTQRLLNDDTDISTTNDDGSQTLSTYRTESVNGQEITYFQAKSGSRIEAVADARPTSNRQDFEDRVVRSALYALGWSFDFAYNPTKIGGAPMRVVVDRINRRAKAVLNDLVIPYYLRFQNYRVRKFIKLGLLAENPDWWKWSVGGFDKITADAKYDADVDIMEMAAGIKTQQQCTAERNGYWQDVNIQKEAEADDKLTRAKALAEKHDVTMDVALLLMGTPSKTGNMPLAEEKEAPEPTAPALVKPEE